MTFTQLASEQTVAFSHSNAPLNCLNPLMNEIVPLPKLFCGKQTVPYTATCYTNSAIKLNPDDSPIEIRWGQLNSVSRFTRGLRKYFSHSK